MLLVQTAASAVAIYLTSWIIYCRYLHPLRAIPGPFLASVSRAWIVWRTASGDMEHTQRALHWKHGTSDAVHGPERMTLAHESGHLIRIAPNEISCSDPESIKVRIGPSLEYPS